MEQLLESAVDQDIAALGVLEMDHRRRVVENGLHLRFAQPVLLLRRLALDELPDLGSNRYEHLHHVRVQRLDFPAEELDHSHNFFPVADGERTSTMQPSVSGVLGSGTVHLHRPHVGNPIWISRLKSSITPTISFRSRMGNAQAPCNPASRAYWARGQFISTVSMLGIQTGSPLAQTWPGRLIPGARVNLRLSAANSFAWVMGAYQVSPHRNRLALASTPQNAAMSHRKH